MSCKRCGSWAINHGHHGRDGSDPELCDVCYWRKRTEAKDAELAGYVEANRHMKGELDDALEDARKYCEAQGEIARLREALGKIAKGRVGLDPEESDAEWRAYWANLCIDYRSMARAALAQVAEVGR